MQIHKTRITILVSVILVILYSLLHTWWVDTHPPMRNDDHFNTEIVLSQHDNPNLYPNDLAWANAEFASSHGFIFLAFLRLSENLFGAYRDAWSAFTLLFLLVYIPGFYLFIYKVTGLSASTPLDGLDIKRHWLALTLALVSTMPIYLYVTFANWGITSVYAHVFVTALSGWLFFGLLCLLKRAAFDKWWAWGIFGLAVSLTVHLNPVNGGGLIGILTVMLFLEVLASRLSWRGGVAFLGGALIGMIPYVVGYVQTLSPTTLPSQADYDAAQNYMANYYGSRLYPWVINETLAPILLAAVVISAVITLVLFSRKDPPMWWMLSFAAIQILPAYLLIGHPVFLLVMAYWWFRTTQQKVDRWDRMFLAMMVAANLIAPVTSGISKYMWLERDLNVFFTLMFETIRMERWVMLAVYVFISRWIAELIFYNPDEHGLLNWIAAVCILATVTSIFGANNPVKDDAILMKTFLPVRWALPIFTIGILSFKRLNLWMVRGIWMMFRLLGLGFVLGMMAWENVSSQGVAIFLVLAAALVFVIYRYWEDHRHVTTELAIIFAATVILPISGYHKDKPDINWCDAPFLSRCVDGDNVEAAADWMQEATPVDAYIYVIGLQPERFQPMAQRSTVHINYSQIYWFQGANALLDALKLDEQLAGTNPLRADYRGDDYLLSTLDEIGANYIVLMGSEYEFDLPIVYENESVTIYELDNAS